MSKNILVTGGCGFIGSHIVDKLIELGYYVTVVDDLSAGTNLKYLQPHLDNNTADFFQYDIRDFKQLQTLPHEYSAIFHLAAQPDVKLSVTNPRLDFEINIDGTFNVLELMRLKDVPKMVFTSSGGTIYGETGLSNVEAHPLRPISNYGAAKAAMEMYCSSYASLYDLNISTARLGNVFGPRSTHGVMYDFYHKLLKTPLSLEILGDGKQTKTYLYIDDAISAFILLFQNLSATYDVFNVSSSEVITVTEIADELVKVLEFNDTTYSYTGGRRGWKGDVIYASMDISKLRSLGWSHTISIEQGIHMYVQWLKTI